MSRISIAQSNSGRMRYDLKVSSLYNFMLASIFVLFVPAFVTRIIAIPNWTIIRLSLILLVDFCVIIKQFRQLTKYKLTNLFSLLYIYCLIITFFANSEDTLSCFIRTFTAISCVMYTEFVFRKFKTERSINILFIAFEIFNYLNLLAMLRYPYGMFRVVTTGNVETIVEVTSGYRREYGRVLWLLGHQTNLNRFTLPAIVLAIIYSYQHYPYKFRIGLRSIAIIFCCLLETYIARSAMNYIALALFFIMLILSKLYGRIKLWHIIVAIILIYLFLLVGTDNELGLSWMSVFLGREVTLSTRLPIWINSLEYIKQSPVFGHGFINEESLTIRNILGLGNPHSTYLWVLVEGGIIGLSIFINAVYLAIKQLKNVDGKAIRRLIVSAVVTLMMVMITDDHIFRSQISIILFFLCYFSPQIKRKILQK